MNKTKKQNSHNSDDFWNFLKQEALSEKYRQLKQATESHTHPTGEMLYDYVTGGLNDEEAMIIRRHIAYCSVCSNEVLNIRRIENELEKPVKTGIVNKVTDSFSSFSNLRLVFAMAVCFVIVLSIFGLQDHLFKTPISVDIRIIANPARPLTRAKHEVPGDFELKQGDILRTNDEYKITIRTDEDAFVYAFFYDSQGEINSLSVKDAHISRELLAGKTYTVLYSEGEIFQLDDQTGTETVYVLASDNPVENFDNKLENLGRAGISKINTIFPNAAIHSFSFKHE